jgi:hypothetical protein
VYGSAYSKVERLPQPAGYPYYCEYAGTKVVAGSPLSEGGLAWSTTTWAQSTKNLSNIVGSWMYAYRAGTYYSTIHDVPGIGC